MMMPQFARAAVYQFRTREMSVGLTIFVIGLFKKVVIAGGVVAPLSPDSWLGLLRWLDLDMGWSLGQYLLLCFIVVRWFPNTQQIMGRYRPTVTKGILTGSRAFWQWRPNARWAVVIGGAGLLATSFIYRWNQAALPKVDFLYFQF